MIVEVERSTRSQLWRFVPNGDAYSIENLNSGLIADVWSISHNKNAEVKQGRSFGPSDNQLWYAIPQGNGVWQFKAKHSSQFLAIQGTRIVQNNVGQDFKFTSAPVIKLPKAAFTWTANRLIIDFNGSASTGGDGTITRYSWDLGDGNSTIGVSPTHRYIENCYTVTLTVTNDLGESANKANTVCASSQSQNLAPLATAVIATVTNPSGGGNHDIEIIRDGVKPNIDSTLSFLQYDTFDSGAGPAEEYIGYTFAQNYNFSKVVFQEGKHFFDGGFFGNGLVVQVRSGSTWSTVASSINPAYPYVNDGISFESFDLTLNTPTVGNGIRIFGTAAGSLQFISVGELEVYAKEIPPPPPIANFTSTVSDLAATFDANSSSSGAGTIVSYAWDFGDGSSATGVSASHAYLTGGVYKVRLTITNSQGGSAIGTKDVTVVDAPPPIQPTVSFLFETTGLSVVFDANSSIAGAGAIVSYTWDFGDGSSAPGVTATHNYSVAGLYTVSLTITNSAGGSANGAKSVTVAEAPAPVQPTVAFIFNATDLSVVFDANASTPGEGTIVTYGWDFGDGSFASGVTATHNYSVAGIYTVSLTVTNSAGGIATAVKSVTVEVPPPVKLTGVFIFNATDLSVAFDANSSTPGEGTIVTYVWDFGDGNSGTGLTATHNYSVAGIYSVSLTITNSAGGSAIVTKDVTVTAPLPVVKPTVAFIFNATDLTVVFDANASTPVEGTIVTYVWDFGDGSFASGVTTTHNYSVAGIYTVSLTITNSSGGSAIGTKDVTVAAPLPVVKPTGAFVFNATDLSVVFDANASTPGEGTISTYVWDFGDGNFASGVTTTHLYSVAGIYTVTLTVTNSAGGISTAVKPLTVAAGPPQNIAPLATAVIATVMNPSGGGNHNIEIIRDGVKPSIGNRSSSLQYDTFDGGAGPLEEYIGYTFAQNYNFSKVVFQEGKHFFDGGFFGSGLVVQVRSEGSWKTVASIINPAYPYVNDGTSFETFELSLTTPTLGNGIRIFGTASGSVPFISVGELEVYAREIPPQIPTADFTSTANDLAATFDANFSTPGAGTIVSYGWDFGDGASGTGVTATHLYSTAGPYTVTLTITNSAGGISTAVKPVTVAAPPPPSVVKPTGNFIFNTTDLSVVFDANSSTPGAGTIVSYGWDFGDGASGTGVTATHLYSAAGPYTVILTVMNSDGGISSAVKPVTVSAPPPPPIKPTGAFIFNATDLSVVFDANSSTPSAGTIVSYSWDFGDSASGTGVTATHLYSVAGIYTVTLTITNSAGGISTAVKPVTVAAPPPPSVVKPTGNFIFNTTDLSVVFDANSSTPGAGTIVTYGWDFGDGTSETGVTTTHLYSVAGIYTVSLTVTNSAGGSDIGTKDVIVATPPPSVVKPTGAFIFNATDLSVAFDANSSIPGEGTIVTYGWDFGDGTSGTGVTETHLYSVAGIYTVTLTITNSAGGISTAVKPMTVAAGPPQNIAPLATAVIATVTNPRGGGNHNIEIIRDGVKPNIGNSSSSLQYDTYDGGAGPLEEYIGYTFAQNYNFSKVVFQEGKHFFDGGFFGSGLVVQVRSEGSWKTVASIINPAYPYVNDGTSFESFDLILNTPTVGNGIRIFGTAAGSLQFISVGELEVYAKEIPPSPPTANFTSIVNDLAAGFDANFSIPVVGTIVSYSWDFGDGTSGVGVTATHLYSTAGPYTVILTIMNSAGGISSAVKLVTVQVPPVKPTGAFISNATDLSVVFDANSSIPGAGTIVSYSWDFGDGISGAGVTVTHLYSTAGPYTVTLTVTNSAGGIATTVKLLTVEVAPINLTGAFIYNATDLSVAFDANSSTPGVVGTIVTYGWDFGDGTSGTGVTTAHHYSVAGLYSVTLTITNSAGEIATVVKPVTVQAPPPIKPTGNFIFNTTDLSGVFDANSSIPGEGTIVTYGWDFGDGHFGSGVTATHLYSVVGIYTVTLTVTNSAGGIDTVVRPLTKLVLPIFPLGATKVYEATSLLALAVSVNSTSNATSMIVEAERVTNSQLWTFVPHGEAYSIENLNSGFIAEVLLFSHNENAEVNEGNSFGPADNQLWYAMYQGRGVWKFKAKHSGKYLAVQGNNIVQNSVGQGFRFTKRVDPAIVLPSDLLEGISATYSVNLNGNDVTFVSWDMGDGTILFGLSVSHVYATPGAYTVTAHISNLSETWVDVSTVEVRAKTPPTCSTPGNVVTGESFNGTVNPGGFVVSSVLWDMGDGLSISGQNISHIYSAGGTYAVMVSIDAENLTFTCSQQVLISNNIGPGNGISPLTGPVMSGISFNLSVQAFSRLGAVTTYDWDMGNGDTRSGSSISYIYPTDGTYIITVTMHGDQGIGESKAIVKVNRPSTVGTPKIYMDTDANNEKDDQHFIAYGIFSELEVIGFNSVHALNDMNELGNYNELINVINLSSQSGPDPKKIAGWAETGDIYRHVFHGATRQYNQGSGSWKTTEPIVTEAAKMLLASARGADPGNKVWWVPVGAGTNVISAIIMAYDQGFDLSDRVRIFWLGSQLNRAGEFNYDNDPWSITQLSSATSELGIEFHVMPAEVGGRIQGNTNRYPNTPIGNYLRALLLNYNGPNDLFDQSVLHAIKSRWQNKGWELGFRNIHFPSIGNISVINSGHVNQTTDINHSAMLDDFHTVLGTSK